MAQDVFAVGDPVEFYSSYSDKWRLGVVVEMTGAFTPEYEEKRRHHSKCIRIRVSATVCVVRAKSKCRRVPI